MTFMKCKPAAKLLKIQFCSVSPQNHIERYLKYFEMHWKSSKKANYVLKQNERQKTSRIWHILKVYMIYNVNQFAY